MRYYLSPTFIYFYKIILMEDIITALYKITNPFFLMFPKW